MTRSVPLPALAGDRDVAPAPAPARTADRRPPVRTVARLARVPWPLLVVLPVQAALSLPLARSNTAFQDEGLYLWVGHLEIAHWLHGTAIPAFPAFLSGSPVLYPPLGALADSAGGLAAARILSLGFMLAATGLLWGTAGRLYGRRAAFFACAVFALAGPALRLGAFATYDAMSLALLALAAWCAVRAGERQKSSGWLVAAALALALANSTKYASALFDPVIAGLVVLTGLRFLGARRALGRGGTLLGYTAGIAACGLAFGGGEYWTAITHSTLARVNSTDSVLAVVTDAWHLTGVVVAAAFAGALLCLAAEPGWPDRLLIWLTAGAALLVPLAQARIHTTTSLDKHVAFGAWFAAIAAGYAADRIIRWARPAPVRWAATAVFVLLLVVPARIGVTQSRALFGAWPNSAALITTLTRALHGTTGPILAEHPSLPEYYLPAGRQWERWSSTHSIRLPSRHSISPGHGGSLAPGAYLRRIRNGFFTVVILDFGPTASLDARLSRALEHDYHYHLAAEVPYGRHGAVVWEYQPRRHFSAAAPRPPAPARPAALGVLTPDARPSPVLGTIVLAVTITGILTLAIMLGMRFTWRRGKASDDL